MELRLRHPEIEFEGVIDLVYLKKGDTIIAEYKSGRPKDDHRTQVLRYALLWWRVTGAIPQAAEVRYLDDVITMPISEQILTEAESSLNKAIMESSRQIDGGDPAAILGDHCRFCDVRQFCKSYWVQPGEARSNRAGFADLGITVLSRPSEHGFEATSDEDKRIAVTFDAGIGQLHFDEVHVGQSYRLIGAQYDPRKDEVRVVSSTEVWRAS